MEIARKSLGENALTGLEEVIVIDDRIIIDLKNKYVQVQGSKETLSPKGIVIKTEPYSYQVFNVPAENEVKDDEGNITPAVEANPRFDNLVISEVGKMIKQMIQSTIDKL